MMQRQLEVRTMAAVFSVLLLMSCDGGNGKYQIGDCITPTDPTYTWYGHYATVKAYSAIDGYRDKNYVLEFHRYNSTNSLFSTSIEAVTKKVSKAKCAL